ncbi:MAG TPA: J domain-containing protein [Oligoflexia bacterium]|nr:J domain-containing protein [Oligoflexia bacterium]HMP48642.1 J domain-containing protein [Oligoflexia bacterium]
MHKELPLPPFYLLTFWIISLSSEYSFSENAKSPPAQNHFKIEHSSGAHGSGGAQDSGSQINKELQKFILDYDIVSKVGVSEGKDSVYHLVSSKIPAGSENLIRDETRASFVSSDIASLFIVELEAELAAAWALGTKGLGRVEEGYRLLEALFPRAHPLRNSTSTSLFNAKRIETCILRGLGAFELNELGCFWKEAFSRDNDPAIAAFLKAEILGLDEMVLDNSFDQIWLKKIAISLMLGDCASSGVCEPCKSSDEFSRTIGHIPFLGVPSDSFAIKYTGSIISSKKICRKAIIDYLLARGLRAVDAGDAVETSNMLSYLNNLVAPEEVVTELVSALAGSVDPGLAELRTNFFTLGHFLSLPRQSQFAMLGSGHVPIKIYLTLFALVLGTSAFIMLLVYLIYRGLAVFITRHGEYTDVEARTGKAGSSRKGRMGLSEKLNQAATDSSRPDQYSALLSIFNLSETATESEIKKAYREKIKNLHPDSSDNEEIQKFKDTKKAYDRIMELRKAGFGE